MKGNGNLLALGGQGAQARAPRAAIGAGLERRLLAAGHVVPGPSRLARAHLEAPSDIPRERMILGDLDPVTAMVSEDHCRLPNEELTHFPNPQNPAR